MKKPLSTIPMREEIGHVDTVVVKVGSRIVTSSEDRPCADRVRELVEDVVALRESGVRVVLITSGAIAHGMAVLGLNKRPATMPMKQACASIGQSRLMQVYELYFQRHGVPVGQVLVTWDDLRDKERYFNLRNTLFQLLDCDAIPIINENDSVSVQEIRFGNNDTLGAQISMLVNADLFVMLTDVNGLYESDPRTHPHAAHIPVVPRITAHMHKSASGSATHISVGGMATKLKAAEMALRAGAHAVVGNGYDRRLCDVLRDPAVSTLFLPPEKRLNARDRWIAFAGKPRGSLGIDEGARRALVEKGKSLLPAGVKSVHGTFAAGDSVEIICESGDVVARGLAGYDSHDIELIRGLQTSAIAAKLGQKPFDEVVHRDNMVVL